jgi:hypothetical protein
MQGHPHFHLKRRVVGIAALVALLINGVVSTADAVTAPTIGRSDPRLQLVRVVATHDAPRAISVTEVIAGASTRAAAQSFASAVSVVTKCWSLNAYRVGKNILGGTLYTLHTKTNWCGDGSLIRTHAYTTTDATTVIGWKYYGLSQNTDSFGVNTGQFESIRVGQFCTLNCLFQNKHEYIDVKVGPSGQIFRS